MFATQPIQYTQPYARCLISLLLCLLFSIHSGAQTTTIVSDDFNDNAEGWPEENENQNSIHVSDGKLVICKKSPGGKLATIKRFADPQQDFLLEADFSISGVTENKGAGLVWGHSRASGLDNAFLVSPNGYYLIRTDHPGRRDAGEWTKATGLNPPPERNRLTVKQENRKLLFLINGRLQKEISFLPWFDKCIGILMFSRGTLSVDNFIFKSDSAPLTNTIGSTGIVKENLGRHINSASEDIKPIISADNRHLYFGRKLYHGNTGGEKDRQDIWYSHSTDGENWAPAKNMGREINTGLADNLCGVSADNNTIMFYTDLGNNRGGFIVRSRRPSGWGPPERLDLELSNESDFLESCLSADGAAILFTAKSKSNMCYRQDMDERDIYVTVKGKKGWTRPVNLGSSINSPDDEFSPFLAADGRTLYFATDGRPGYGDVDIFMARRIGEGWTEWTVPVNLGPEINTPDFDAYYTVPASGKYAYMVTYQNSFGRSDIVRVKLPDAAKPNPVVLVTGKVLDATTRKPISATVSLRDQQTLREAATVLSHPGTGEYQLVVQERKSFRFFASAEGYLTASEDQLLPPGPVFAEVQRDLLLYPATEDRAITLENVLFEKGTADLLPGSQEGLNRLVRVMKDNPTVAIMLSGHTDNQGTPTALNRLSAKRVEEIIRYMVNQGIERGRLSGRAFGPSRPLVRNDTEENRSRNRRVEFTILKSENSADKSL